MIDNRLAEGVADDLDESDRDLIATELRFLEFMYRSMSLGKRTWPPGHVFHNKEGIQ